MKSPAGLTTQARSSAAVVVPPGRCADASMDLTPIHFFRTSIEVTLSSNNSAVMLFPMAENVRINLGSFRPTDCSKENGRASFDARDQDPNGEKSDCESQRGTQTTANIASLTIIKKLQRHKEANKASDEKFKGYIL